MPPGRAISRSADTAPSASTTAPPTASARPTASRTLPLLLPARASSAGRRAASGATRVAARAGASAASTVIRIPTTRPMMTADGGTASVANSVSGWPWSTAMMPAIMPTAASTPTTEAAAPTSTASASTDRRIWPRSAPMQRSRASSRVRWAISTEKVLETTRAATNSATSANANRTMVSWSAPPVRLATTSLVCSAAVFTEASGNPAAASAAVTVSLTAAVSAPAARSNWMFRSHMLSAPASCRCRASVAKS